MQVCKLRVEDGQTCVGVVQGSQVQLLTGPRSPQSLSAILHDKDPEAVIRQALQEKTKTLELQSTNPLPPIDRQEVWAAGVTYKRSQEARERESAGAARFYDLVYSAERPELFLKAPAHRVVGPGGVVRIRRDSRWSVPEPELALIVSPDLQIVGYTIGNDMSARDIEGENPLYLPQAKIYDGSCAVGPVITLAAFMPPLEQVAILLRIDRGAHKVFEGTTSPGAMKHQCQDLVNWLGRETSFPDGAILLTGTGIVPPDEFTLAAGDIVSIDITGIGTLTNRVEQDR